MSIHRISGRALGVGSLVVVAILFLAPATPAFADDTDGARGVARLGRHDVDVHYRARRDPGSRSIRYTGRPFHPRFTRHRQTCHVPRCYDDRDRGRRDLSSQSIRYTGRPFHPRFTRYRQPCRCAPSRLARPIYVVEEAPEPLLRQRVTREDIEMVPIRVARREATQRPVLERVALADGSVRTIIRSVPIEQAGRDESAPETAVAERAGDGPRPTLAAATVP